MFLFLKKQWISFSLNLVTTEVYIDFKFTVNKTAKNGKLYEFHNKKSRH